MYLFRRLRSDSSEHVVIDGQQRLTTFILLLKAMLIKISNALEKIRENEDTEKLKAALVDRQKEIIKSLYSINEDDLFDVIANRIEFSKLSIKYKNTSINEKYFNEIATILSYKTFEEIEKKVITIPHKKHDNKYSSFFKNFKFLYEKLAGFQESQLNEFAKNLLGKCQIIIIISYQTEEAIEIFHSLNSTGLPLADADILAAKLYNYYQDDKTKFNAHWEEIIKDTSKLSNIKVTSIDEILNQYMYILRAEKDQKDTTLPGVRRYFTDNRDELLRDPKKFITDIEKIIKIWQDSNSSTELTNLKQILLKLNNNFKFYYAAYLYFNNDAENKDKEAFAKELLKLFAILEIGETGYSSSNFKIFLIGLNMDIGKSKSTEFIVNRIKEQIKHFEREKIYAQIADSNPANGIIYLNEYLFAKEKNDDINLKKSDIHIEHIMSESGKDHASIMKDANLNNDEEFKDYVNKIGNKILLESNINIKLSDNWFRTKKQGYKDSNFPIAKSLASYSKDSWKKDDIDTATEKAAKRITDFIFDKISE